MDFNKDPPHFDNKDFPQNFLILIFPQIFCEAIISLRPILP